MSEKNAPRTTVLYNANCPVCSYEIDHYAAYADREALPLRFDDLNDATMLADWGLDADTAARRLHVMKEGQLLAGIPAFIALWQDMPKYHWLARVVALPVVFQFACGAYDFVLAPLIYRWHLRRLRRSAVKP